MPIFQKIFGKKKVNKGFYSTGFNTYFLGKNQPLWINTQNLLDYVDIVSTNPIVHSALMLRASYMANGRVNIKDLKTGEIITRENVKLNNNSNKIVKKAFNLFSNPNVLQSTWEFITTYIVMKDTFGNAFLYGLKPEGFEMNIQNVKALWNVYPQYMNVVFAGSYFSATDINEIIKEWRWGYAQGKQTIFKPEEILHRKDVNISLREGNDLIFGVSKLKSLQRPISNIDLSYESENVILKNRGARFLVSLAKENPSTGMEPAQESEKEEAQKDFEEYGVREGQKQAIITRMPVDITTIDQDIRKLGIFESIANSSMAIANEYSIPFDLFRWWVSGSTFENQNQAEKRFYQNAIIPEFTDLVDDLNSWLKLPDFGYEYVPDFSQIAVLQEDKKENAIANRNISMTYADLFMKNGCTYNTWLKAIGSQEQSWGNKRLSELSDREILIITGNLNQLNTQNNAKT